MSNTLAPITPRPLRLMSAIALAAGLAACGGGGNDGGSPTVSKLSGTAAVGDPISGGTVTVQCSRTSSSSSSAPAPLTTTTSTAGAWSVNVTEGNSLPCAVRVTSGDLALHSIAVEFGTVNITPLTDLIIANAAAQTPATWWSGGSFATLTKAALDKSLENLRTALKLADLNGLDPRTGAFEAKAGDKIDDMLEALKKTLASQNASYGELLAAATAAQFTLAQNFQAALAAAYTAQRTGSSNGGGNSGGSNNGGSNSGENNSGGNNGGGTTTPGGGTTIPGGGGNYTLKLVVNASGIAGPAITLTNMPKPANQSEFCDGVKDSSSSTSLNSQIGGAGTLTINSCSFNGTVGTVNATMSITSPVSMTVPYSVTYTYSN